MWVMCEWPRHKVVLTVSITGRLQPTEAKHVRSHGWLPVVRSHELTPPPANTVPRHRSSCVHVVACAPGPLGTSFVA